MARTAAETAHVLSKIFDVSFARDTYEKFRISWPQLRSLAGVSRLTPIYIRAVNHVLNDSEYSLVPFDNFLIVARESDFAEFRAVPDRVVESYLPDEEQDDDDDLEFDDDYDDDVEIDDTDDDDIQGDN